MEDWRKDARREPILVELEALVPETHLLRKIERVMDYEWLYERLAPYYCHDNGRPGTDPVVLIKMVLIQHLFGIPSLRQTHREIQVNLAYRWFLGYGLLEDIPHFATVSYAFCKRFPDELTGEIFEHILNKALNHRMSTRAQFSLTAPMSRPVPTRKSFRRNRSRRRQGSIPDSCAERSTRKEKGWARSPLKTGTTKSIPGTAEKRQKRRFPPQTPTAECS